MELINKNISRTAMIILGSLIYALGVNIFLIPHKLLSGGVAGVSILIQYITGISSGYFVILLNIPIFIIGIRAIDKEFGILSFIGMGSMSLFLILTKNISSFYSMSDPLLSCLCGGIITGVGAGIIFRSRGSEGGTDIISVILKKKYGMTIGTISFGLNALVVFFGTFIGNLESAVYTLISMYMKSKVIDKAIEGFDKEKAVIVITQNSDGVKDAIYDRLGRGVTYLYGEGAYKGDKKNVIYCILTAKQIETAKRLIQEIDSTAVVSIIETTEVQGQGFKAAAL